MCNCCCNTQQKRCYQLGIMFASVYIIVFEMVLAIYAENKMKPEELNDLILSERPLFDFEISQNDISGKTNITFFEYKGRKVYYGNRADTVDKTNFTKIYKHKFFYNGKDRNYFDYKNKYSVQSSEDCPTNHKKCGILDSTGRILCLPNDEECPLNGFKITETNDNPFSGVTEFEQKIVSYDDDVDHYIWYTNKNYNGKIITEFKLSKGAPCAKSSEISWHEYYQNEVEGYYGCKTSIDGSTTSTRYTKVNEAGINMKQLYKDNGLTNEPNYPYFNGDTTTVDLYARNYNEIDEICVDKFLGDFEDDKKYFDKAFKISRALSLIGLILILALFIYILTTCSCCCNLTYHGIVIIIPIYGLVANIVIISIMNKAEIKYKCQIEGSNSELDDEMDKQYGNNLTNIIFSILNIAGYSIVFLFAICLQFMRNKGIIGIPPVSSVVPVYPGAYPAPAYDAPYGKNIPYQNVVPGSGSI